MLALVVVTTAGKCVVLLAGAEIFGQNRALGSGRPFYLDSWVGVPALRAADVQLAIMSADGSESPSQVSTV
jgi:hypothetical protein